MATRYSSRDMPWLRLKPLNMQERLRKTKGNGIMQFNWPKKLQTRFLIGLTGITFAGGLLFAVALYNHMHALLESEAADKAALILSQAEAVQHYVRHTLRPLMYKVLPDDEFMMESMSSSFISRSIMERVDLGSESHIYRRVAINARNPDFEATPREVRLIEHFQEKPYLFEWSGFETFNDHQYFVAARPVRFGKGCMNCHGEPEHAPRQLLERYGRERGFGREAGAIFGMTEVLVPVQDAMLDIRGATVGTVSFAVAGALFCFAVANVLFNRLVVHNVRRIGLVFPKYFGVRAEPPLMERLQRGNEIEEILVSVEDLAKHLSEAQDKLEDYAVNLKRMVDDRTADLRQEASDRRSDVALFVRLLRTLNNSHTRRELIQSALPQICKRYGVKEAAFVCTFSSQNFYSWPNPDKRPTLPDSWKELVTESRPLFFPERAYVPVETQVQAVEGLLCLFWEPDTFEPEREGDVLVALGRQLGVAMENLNFQDRLLQQNAMLQSIFEGISDPLLLLDHSCGVLMANHAALSLVPEGERPRENETCFEALFGAHTVGDSTPDSMCLPEVIRNGSPTCFELQQPNGRSFNVSAYPLPQVHDQPGRVVVYARENTAEKRMLAEIQQHEKLITVGKLAAGLAHEINNPLGVIHTYAELLQSSEMTPQNGKDVEVIIQHTRKAQKVLQDLLNFARPKHASTGPCDPLAVIRDVGAVFSVQAEARHVALDIQTEAHLPTIDADPAALEQILSNLLLNALDAAEAAPSGKGCISLLAGVESGNKELSIHVADNGPGISKDDVPHIFDPFFTTKEVGKGTGLGLAVVYGLLQEMGGRIDVRNQDSGAMFSLHLPLTPRRASTIKELS